MWQAVRRELARLEWDPEPPLAHDLLAEWTQTVQNLMAIRQALGPVSTQDPVAMLATATTGAVRATDGTPTAAPSLHDVRAALAGVARTMEATSDHDWRRERATLNHVAYELTHRVRVRTPDPRANAWLLAGETALDSVIYAPTGRSATGIGLAVWQDALAAVQPVQHAAIVRRSVALGHLGILQDAHSLVQEARQTGALPRPYCDALLGNIQELARAHQTTLSQIDGRRLGTSRVDQAVMLKLGGAVRQISGSPDAAEPSHLRLDALLRSSIGQAVVVANLTGETSAQPVASALRRLALEYLANPGMLRPADPPDAPMPVTPVERTASLGQEPRAPVGVGQTEPSIRPGTVLDGPTVLALCRARDLGVAAGTGDPASPPEILRGVDPSRWPQLVAEGRQAVTDLVASVIPMVYAQTRHALNAADLRGQMFIELMGAAHRFDPQRIGPERWPKYAWMSLEHARWRGVDESGVVRKRSRNPRLPTVAIDGREPASRAPGPDEAIEERQSIAAITQALGHLPRNLRDPLVESMQGLSAHAIGNEFGFSESTARRRLQAARDRVRHELALLMDDGVVGAYENVTDPVLERSRRMFEQAFSPLIGPEPGCGPDR